VVDNTSCMDSNPITACFNSTATANIKCSSGGSGGSSSSSHTKERWSIAKGAGSSSGRAGSGGSSSSSSSSELLGCRCDCLHVRQPPIRVRGGARHGHHVAIKVNVINHGPCVVHFELVLVLQVQDDEHC